MSSMPTASSRWSTPDIASALAAAADYRLGQIERVRSAIVAEKLSMTRQQWFRIRKAALGYDVP